MGQGHRSKIRWLLGLSAIATLWSTSASAGNVRIRLLRQQGKNIHIYHDEDKAAGAGKVEVLIGATACEPLKSESLRPLRGNDAMTTLIVLDRGGTRTSGMGPYSEQIRQAVGGFLQSVVGKTPGDKVTLIDTAGGDSPPEVLAPTNNYADVKSYLDNLKPPSGAGADVFGVAVQGLSALDRAGTPLGAVILISDGVDVAADGNKGATDSHATFIREAKKRGVPVAALHVNRQGVSRGDDDVKFRNGRGRMTTCANDTNGDMVSVVAGPELAPQLRRELDQLGRLFAQVQRTTCKVCGKTEAKDGALVDLKVRNGSGAVVTQSLTSPRPQLDLPAEDYGACDLSKSSSVTSDSECNEGERVEHGKCVKQGADKKLVLIGVLLGLAALVGLWAWRRSEQRKRAAEMAERDARERALAEKAAATARDLAKAEQERERAMQAAAAAAEAANRRQPDPALEQLLNPDVVRLIAAPGSSEGIDRVLKAGVYIIGAGDAAEIRLQSPTVSTQHAQLEVDKNGGLRLMDLGSSNGTFVNNVPLPARSPTELRVGDVIAFSRQVQVQIHAVAGGPQGGGGRRPYEATTLKE